MDPIIAVLICGRFFYYVAKDARISNTPPNSELEDRVSLLWTWFAFLAAYVVQILMAIGLIIGTRTNDREVEDLAGSAQLWLHFNHLLLLYTFIELIIVFYLVFSVKNLQGSRAILVIVLAIIKLVFRIVAFVIVKLFMADLNRPSCSCPNMQQSAPHQQQPQQTLPQPTPPQPQQPPPAPVSHHNQIMMMAHPSNSQFQQAAAYHPT